LNTDSLHLREGESISYYFEVVDNDGVNGPKASRTERMQLNLPKKSDLERELENRSSEVKSQLSEAAKKAVNIQQEARKLSDLLIQKQSLGFEEKAQVKELIDAQRELEEFLQRIREEKEAADMQ